MPAIHFAPYTGKSEYCYSNSLHMALSAKCPKNWTVPDPGFLECLTTMPFGNLFLDLPRGPQFLCSPADVDPESGLDRAVKALGWMREVWHGGRTSSRTEVLRHLTAALKHGPLVAGPLDLGELPHNPRSRYLRGGDHFVTVLSSDTNGGVFHDPFGYPYARVAVDSFLRSWRADRIPYKHGSYGLRSNFRTSEPRTRLQAISFTLPLLAQSIAADPGGPRVFGGSAALARLVQAVTNKPPRSLVETLVYFSLPLGARRRTDGHRFMLEAGNPWAAKKLDEQSRILGGVQIDAVQGEWGRFVRGMNRFAEIETELTSELQGMVPGSRVTP